MLQASKGYLKLKILLVFTTKTICHMCVCLSVCLSVCLFTFEVPFNGLFAPTSRSRMTKFLRDSESSGKSNGKKWSQIWKLLLIKGVKLRWQKSFLLFFCICSLHLNVYWPPLQKVQCPNFLAFRNSRGKVLERFGLRFENFCS